MKLRCVHVEIKRHVERELTSNSPNLVIRMMCNKQHFNLMFSANILEHFIPEVQAQGQIKRKLLISICEE